MEMSPVVCNSPQEGAHLDCAAWHLYHVHQPMIGVAKVE